MMTDMQSCTRKNHASRRARLSELGSTLLSQALTPAATVRLWRCHRSERHHLKNLDDHVLADLGLTRAEVEREVRQPFWRPVDPRRIED